MIAMSSNYGKRLLSVQVDMKADLRETYGASTRAAAAGAAVEVFAGNTAPSTAPRRRLPA
jgi:hypothetical protein